MTGFRLSPAPGAGVRAFDALPVEHYSAELERLSRIVASYPPGHSALFLSLTTNSCPERTPAMTTTTRTEYGARFLNGDRATRWPGHSSSRPGKIFFGLDSYVDASDLDALHAAAARVNADGAYRPVELVSRTITTTETVSEPVVVKPPVKLPTAKASVVKATVDGERSVFYLDVDGDWSRTKESVAGRTFCQPADLSDVEVVFDAAGVTL